ncbi:MAG: hypothetical protein J5705_03470 [Bacteroidaceae bacterium]|nr:hypothetical protein [Bacteroidaceae bacterium]
MKRGIILLSLLLLSAGCQKNSYPTFSKKYRVWYSCSILDAPFNQITTPGRFLAVSKKAGKLRTVDSDGNKTETELSAIQNNSYIMGLAGLIIGTPTFNNDDMSVWAFDLGCPVCDNEQAILSFDTQGIARCSKCGGSWNLNASGFPLTDSSQRPLYRYPVMKSDNSITVSN